MHNLYRIRLFKTLGRISLYTDDFVSNAWQELELHGKMRNLKTKGGSFALVIFRDTGEIAYRYFCSEKYPHPNGWDTKGVREIV